MRSVLTTHCCLNTAQPKVSVQGIKGPGERAISSRQTRVTEMVSILSKVYFRSLGAKWVGVVTLEKKEAGKEEYDPVVR